MTLQHNISILRKITNTNSCTFVRLIVVDPETRCDHASETITSQRNRARRQERVRRKDAPTTAPRLSHCDPASRVEATLSKIRPNHRTPIQTNTTENKYDHYIEASTTVYGQQPETVRPTELASQNHNNHYLCNLGMGVCEQPNHPFNERKHAYQANPRANGSSAIERIYKWVVECKLRRPKIHT